MKLSSGRLCAMTGRGPVATLLGLTSSATGEAAPRSGRRERIAITAFMISVDICVVLIRCGDDEMVWQLGFKKVQATWTCRQDI